MSFWIVKYDFFIAFDELQYEYVCNNLNAILALENTQNGILGKEGLLKFQHLKIISFLISVFPAIIIEVQQ